MSYDTFIYLLVFLPIVLLAYQLMPSKGRWAVLLLAGYVFFWIISGKLLLYLLATTLFTHGIAHGIHRLKRLGKEKGAVLAGKEAHNLKKAYRQREKRVLIFGIVMLLAVLAYLKYYNFFAANVNVLATHLGRAEILPKKSLLLPIGISFYTLQAIGYMVDVYWGKVEPCSHPGKLALFLGFFPQIMEGPISLYSQTAESLWSGKSLRWENLTGGCQRILWGLFKKVIIADRLSTLVTAIFDHYGDYQGAMIVIGAVSYTVQLYMEFSGCMDIIIGSGQLFGVTLPENFRQPFASRSAAEFWRRWHITLGVWFKTYIFYPVSVSGLVKKWNKFARKHLGKGDVGKYLTKLGVSALCLFPVWICNGLWHGARWSYIFYGMYYFTLLLLGIALEPLVEKVTDGLQINRETDAYHLLQTGKTWIIIFTGEMFFRANGIRAGFHMFFSIFQDFFNEKLWDGSLLRMGLDRGDYLIILLGCLTVAIVGSIKERKLLGDEGMKKLPGHLRWAMYYGLIFAVIIFGAYGVGYQQVDMIYAGF